MIIYSILFNFYLKHFFLQLFDLKMVEKNQKRKSEAADAEKPGNKFIKYFLLYLFSNRNICFKRKVLIFYFN